MNSDREKQKKLVSIIQGVHDHLRYSVQKDPQSYRNIWQNHCNDPIRFTYATAMHTLATEVWAQKVSNGNRIQIAKEMIESYFVEARFLLVIRRMLRKYSACSQYSEKDFKNDLVLDRQLRLLDVGSCYNPFKRYNFDVTAVDLCPAIADVFQCDFVNVRFGDRFDKSDGALKVLPRGYFDAVVFSLLLEYLPHARLRLSVVHNAYKALRENGILVVITPDSKHQQKNMRMIQSWQKAFSALGFDRVSYAKHEHVHCIVVRKLCRISREIMHIENSCGHSFEQLCPLCIRNYSGLLFIHQDKNDYVSKMEVHHNLERSLEEESRDAQLFSELPHI